jgi:hypothetical protein
MVWVGDAWAGRVAELSQMRRQHQVCKVLHGDQVCMVRTADLISLGQIHC